jgi:hypothetical protein
MGGIKGGIKRLIINQKIKYNDELKKKYSLKLNKKFLDKYKNNINENTNKILNEQANYGKKWNENEYKLLTEEINKNLSIEEIIKNHKRNMGGITCGIKRLIIQNPTNQIIKNYYNNKIENTIMNKSAVKINKVELEED